MKRKTLRVISLLAPLIMFFSCSHINHIEKNVAMEKYQIQESDLDGYQFYGGMTAVENLYISEGEVGFIAGDSTGNLYHFSGSSRENIELINQVQLSQGWILGITEGLDGYLYVGVTDFQWKEWLKEGGFIYRVSKDFQEAEALGQAIPGLNGGQNSPQGDIYFASGNMSFLNPQGRIHRMVWDSESHSYGDPELLLEDNRSFNGLSWKDGLYAGGTFSGIFRLEGTQLVVQAKKVRSVQAFDDFCLDSKGRIWMSNPLDNGVSCYIPHENRFIHWDIAGLGQLSSLAIGIIDQQEILYGGEMKVRDSKDYDGRGVFSIPLSTLDNYLVNRHESN